MTHPWHTCFPCHKCHTPHIFQCPEECHSECTPKLIPVNKVQCHESDECHKCHIPPIHQCPGGCHPICKPRLIPICSKCLPVCFPKKIPFDSVNFTSFTLTAAIPTAILATVSLIVPATTDVWLTAFATWTPSSANPTITFRIVRDDSTVITTASDTPVSANSPITTAFIGDDENPLIGSHFYTLTATGNGLLFGQTITINQGTLTAADMIP